jgi:hypothetical protein
LARIKFLTLAVKKGIINEAARDTILKIHQACRVRNENTPVGEVAVQNRYMNESSRDALLKEQRDMRKTTRAREFVINRPSLRLQQLVVAIVAAVGVVVATFVFAVKVNVATGVASFTAYVLITLLQFKEDHSFSLSAIRVAKAFCVGLIFLLIIFAVVSLWHLREIVGLHSNPATRTDVALWLRRLDRSFAILAVTLVALTVYSAWKFQSQRFVEARIGALKDIIIRVETVLRERANLAKENSDSEQIKALDEKLTNEAIQLVLNGLRNILRLNASDRIIRLIRRLWRGRVHITTWYYVPEPTTKRCFYPRAIAYPDEAPESAIRAFNWLRTNHRPVFLNQEQFRVWRNVAKGVNPKGWKTRYLNIKQRYDHASACGWIYLKQETLISRDASQCLVFDDSFLWKMADAGFGKKDLKWVEVGSFVGCPVIGQANLSIGVLLVLKNTRNGLSPEDLELVIVGAQILGRIMLR